VLQRFVPYTHRNALRDRQIQPDAKTQVWRKVPQRAFLWNLYQSHPSMKNGASRFMPSLHYVTCRSNRMQNHKFRITCPGVLFLQNVPVPPEHEKLCVDVSCPKCTGIHYVTRRSQRMQKHKFGITCPGTLFMESVPVPPEHEK
jgi:hypothetical protein